MNPQDATWITVLLANGAVVIVAGVPIFIICRAYIRRKRNPKRPRGGPRLPR